MNDYGFALFPNTSSVMRAEKVLKKGGVVVKLVPTPRELSSDCGMAIRFDVQDKERVRQLLLEARVEAEGIHPS